ncbi:MAG: hypothetical protein J4G16_14690 [Acidobacteria bacterium]|nr:hypothetical protein [Acidobacteriota bacterium]
MSELTMGNVEIQRSTHEKAGLVEYRAEIDAIAARAAARRGVETHTLIAHVIYAAIATQDATAAEGETKH